MTDLVSEQFRYWLLVSVPVLVVGGLVVMAVEPDPLHAYYAAFVLTVPLEYLHQWLQDWEEEQAELSEPEEVQ